MTAVALTSVEAAGYFVAFALIPLQAFEKLGRVLDRFVVLSVNVGL